MYSRTQYSKLMEILSISMILFIGIMMYITPEILAKIILLISAILSVGLLWQFRTLTVLLEEDALRFYFGSGFISKTYRFSEIESCEKVTNKWWYGYGIRLLPSFTLYNVAGCEAIELSFKGKNRKIRIGTDDVEILNQVINKRIGG